MQRPKRPTATPRAPVAGVILAAGSGRRMTGPGRGKDGLPKQLLPLAGMPMLAHVVGQARASLLSPLCLVLGHRAAEIQARIALAGVEVVVNADYANGQAGSLIAGLNRVAPRCDAAMFLLGDQPLISAALLNRLIAAHQDKNAPITLPSFEGRRGNPVIIAADLFAELRGLSGDTGARALFETHAEEVQRVPVDDPAILIDVDTPEDYEALLTR